jgi:hypothetical protein
VIGNAVAGNALRHELHANRCDSDQVFQVAFGMHERSTTICSSKLDAPAPVQCCGAIEPIGLSATGLVGIAVRCGWVSDTYCSAHGPETRPGRRRENVPLRLLIEEYFEDMLPEGGRPRRRMFHRR